MQVPAVHYARSGDLHIAYQTWGEGPRLLIIADLISNAEVTWEHELYRRTLEHVGKHLRSTRRLAHAWPPQNAGGSRSLRGGIDRNVG